MINILIVWIVSGVFQMLVFPALIGFEASMLSIILIVGSAMYAPTARHGFGYSAFLMLVTVWWFDARIVLYGLAFMTWWGCYYWSRRFVQWKSLQSRDVSLGVYGLEAAVLVSMAYLFVWLMMVFQAGGEWSVITGAWDVFFHVGHVLVYGVYAVSVIYLFRKNHS